MSLARGGRTALAATLLLGGCYTHTAVPVERLRPQLQVRALLSEEAGRNPDLPPDWSADRVEGEVLEVSGGHVLLAIPVAVRQEGLGREPLFRRVRLAPVEVDRWEQRRLDWPRTITVAAAAGAVVGWVAYQTFSGEFGGTTTGPISGGGTDSRIPLLRIRLP